MNQRLVVWSFVAVGLVLVMSLGATSPGLATPVAAGQHAILVDQKVDTFVRTRVKTLGIRDAAVLTLVNASTCKDGSL